MTYKSILVHVEPSEAGRARLQATLALTRQFGARLVGVGARAFDPMPDPIGISVMKLKEVVEADLAAAQKLFQDETAASGVDVEWRSDAEYPPSPCCAARLARTSSSRVAA